MKIPYLIPSLIFVLIIVLSMVIFISVSQGVIAQWWYNIGVALLGFGIGLMWYCSIKMWASRFKRRKNSSKKNKLKGRWHLR